MSWLESDQYSCGIIVLILESRSLQVTTRAACWPLGLLLDLLREAEESLTAMTNSIATRLRGPSLAAVLGWMRPATRDSPYMQSVLADAPWGRRA